ncbi:MAG: cobalamin-independent methionine synthase II family protein [SAR324 cluster bacterium]|nr:cobalamin-independent methionine synthase II family protein [SAR324 cluster bacterium]
MKQSVGRILTTHTGSLPRSEALLKFILARDAGEKVDEAAFQTCLRDGVMDIVARQTATGVDVVSDGEQSKISYSTYVKDRMTGFGGEGTRLSAKDLAEYRDYTVRAVKAGTLSPIGKLPCCEGPVALKDTGALETDLRNFGAAVQAAQPEEAFLNAASPGVVAVFLENRHYPSHQAYLEALAAVLKTEYEAIVNAGFLLQIDAPDLAMGRHLRFADQSVEEFRRTAELHIEILNHATAGIPPERMRLHLCWGNYQGPHHHDIPLRDILDVILKARPDGLSLEGANPRHEHEWEVLAGAAIPEQKVLIPGVIDSTSNFIEHPELVAQRIGRYAAIVGRERVIAGSDCGFATFAGYPPVDPKIAWAKLRSLAEGARLASAQLW